MRTFYTDQIQAMQGKYSVWCRYSVWCSIYEVCFFFYYKCEVVGFNFVEEFYADDNDFANVSGWYFFKYWI